MGKNVGYGVRGKLWRVIRRMYDVSRSAVLLGEKSAFFSVEQGVVQGCSLSFSIEGGRKG